MRLGFSDAGSDAPDTTSWQSYDLLSEGFGPGFNGPLLVVTDGGSDGAEQAAADPVLTPGREAATVLAFPSSAPQDEETSELVGTLRDDVLPELSAQNGAQYLVDGSTAASEDYAGKISHRLPLFMAIVVGLSVLLLMAVFRSVLIPLKAAVLTCSASAPRSAR